MTGLICRADRQSYRSAAMHRPGGLCTLSTPGDKRS